MLNVNNYIYTEAGIFSVNDLLNLQKNNVLLPKVLTFNTDKESSNYLTYYFTDINEIEEIPKVDIYEVRFVDVFSSRNIILNISADTEIFQYNVLQTEDHPIINKNYQVIQYLKANIMRTKLNLKWIPIAELTNYANKSPNICMGDTVVKFSHKVFKNNESAYCIKFNSNVVPVFAALSKSTHFNFVLVR